MSAPFELHCFWNVYIAFWLCYNALLIDEKAFLVCVCACVDFGLLDEWEDSTQQLRFPAGAGINLCTGSLGKLIEEVAVGNVVQ